MKSLDKKLKTIAAGKYKPRDFILADAKDPDYAFGVKGTGAHDYLDQSGKHRSIPEFRQTIRDIVKQKQMDVMLGAVSTWNCSSRKACSRSPASRPPSAPMTPPTSGTRAPATTPRSRLGPGAPPTSPMSRSSATSASIR